MIVRSLSNKGLSGTIPPSFSNLKRLYYLNLNSNNISGLLPDLDGFNLLYQLQLSTNSFSGTIPESYKNLPSLKALYVNHYILMMNMSYNYIEILVIII